MDKRGLIKSSLPLVLILVFALTTSGFKSPNLAVVLDERTVGDYSFQDLSHLFPDGMKDIQAVAPWASGALLAGSSASGGSVIVRYDPSQSTILKPFEYLPSYYHGVSHIAKLGNLYFVGGESVGTSPTIGFYDASDSRFTDVTSLLPPDTIEVASVTDIGGSFLTVLRNDTMYIPGIFNPGSVSLSLLDVKGFENLTEVRRAVWNGSAVFLAGKGIGGGPALVALNPSNGSLVDLSDLIPGSMDRIDDLVWAEDALYLLGVDYWFWNDRASLAVYNTSAEQVTSLSDASWNAYTEIPMGFWNGTALILMPQKNGWWSLAAYYPDNDTTLFVDDEIPGYWDYKAMVRSGEDVLLLANYGGPAVGLVRLDTWTWEEGREAFEGPYAVVTDTESMDNLFAIVGTRTSSGALGFLDPSVVSLQDESEGLNLEGTALYGASWNDEVLLLTGANSAGGIVYGYDPVSRTLENLTSTLPADIEYLYDPGWNGNVWLIPGSVEGGTGLVLLDPVDDSITDLSSLAQLYFVQVMRVVAYEGLFLLLGYNTQGAAMATFDPATLEFQYLGNKLGELYGGYGLLMDAAWNGKAFLVGGMMEDGGVMGLWSPERESFEDLSTLLPGDFGIIFKVLWTGKEFIVGGQGAGAASLGAYYPSNKSFLDLSPIIPSSYTAITSLAWLDGKVLVASMSGYSEPAMGILSVGSTASNPLDALPNILKEPSSVTIFSLSIALAAVLAYLMGRRGRKPSAVPPPQPYQRGPYESPEAYSEEYEGYPFEYMPRE